MQMLSSEKLTDEKLAELCADTIEYLDKMKTDLDTKIKITSKDSLYSYIYPDLYAFCVWLFWE